MYLLIILLPLISALTSGLFGRFIGREGAKWITTSSIFVTFLMSCVAFYEVALAGSPCYFEVMTWIDSEMFRHLGDFCLIPNCGNVSCSNLRFHFSSLIFN